MKSLVEYLFVFGAMVLIALEMIPTISNSFELIFTAFICVCGGTCGYFWCNLLILIGELFE